MKKQKLKTFKNNEERLAFMRNIDKNILNLYDIVNTDFYGDDSKIREVLPHAMLTTNGGKFLEEMFDIQKDTFQGIIMYISLSNYVFFWAEHEEDLALLALKYV